MLRIDNFYGTVDDDGVWHFDILKIRLLIFTFLSICVGIFALMVNIYVFKYVASHPYPLSLMNDIVITVRTPNDDISISVNNKKFISNSNLSPASINTLINTPLENCVRMNFIDNFVDFVSHPIFNIKTRFFKPFMYMEIFGNDKYIRYNFYKYDESVRINVYEDFLLDKETKYDKYECVVKKSNPFLNAVVGIVN
jgi:hypothetical protein